ncbi:IS256 family transposase [Lentibacillus daqui]|uniref:IS256 family transposase n=1 Tax=Lentibacillus daqui TaxID=2911514 RepID=UPI0022B0A599|nr:IS256 family transposase [Lentibacillus daqui]
MSQSITDHDFINQLDNLVRDFVKEQLETIMEEERKQFFEVEHPELKQVKNGYYKRSLDTKHGHIDDLAVPRDRHGDFQTELFDPYQRRDQWVGETVTRMYQKGVSTREIGEMIEHMLGSSYSATTVSNITEATVENIEAWQQRPLNKRYSVLYLDGTYLKLRRDDVANEVVYLVIGVNENGYREILGFYVGGQESSLGWKEILIDLYERGAEEVLLGVFDGLPGLETAMKEVYPKADVQRCVVHKIRNALNAVRKKDQTAIAEDLKPIYQASTKEEARKQFNAFKQVWQSKHPKVVKSWEEDLEVLLTFLDYPSSIQRVIYTSNIIERTMKEIKKRTKTMNSLPSERATEKVVYLQVTDYNQRWGERKLRGFASAYQQLQDMFEKRYGKPNNI